MPNVPKLEMGKVQSWGQYQEEKERLQKEKLLLQQRTQQEYIKSISQQGQRPEPKLRVPPPPLDLPSDIPDLPDPSTLPPAISMESPTVSIKAKDAIIEYQPSPKHEFRQKQIQEEVVTPHEEIKVHF